MPQNRGVTPAPTAIDLLADGELEVVGRLVDASNATLYCRIRSGAAEAACVYKPVAGERPLWDFPDGTLAGREVAAYLVAQATGLDVVPPTVLRDGPFGPGSCQLWIDVDDSVDVVALVRSNDPELRPIALLDALINNADRKGGHLLPTAEGRLLGVDHGVCFHQEDKLRTVLWGWRGSRLSAAERDSVGALEQALAGTPGRDPLAGGLARELATLISPAEIAAVRHRAHRLLATGRFPQPSREWPAVPWPPF